MIRPTLRLRRHRGAQPGPDDEAELVEIDLGALTGLFATPGWLRDLGMTSWLLFGVAVMLVGLALLLALTNTIVAPVVTAGIIAAVLSPLVGWLQRHGCPGRRAAAIVFLGVVARRRRGAVAAARRGRRARPHELERALKSGAGKIQSALQDAGVSADQAKQANARTRARASARRSTRCSAASPPG